MAQLIDTLEYCSVKTGPELDSILDDACRHAESIILLGPPGCGKTEGIFAAANRNNKPVLGGPVNISMSDGTDQKGVPNMNENHLKWVKEQRWYTAVTTPITAFFDDFGQGPTIAQCASTSALREHRIDDLYLHPDCWVVAASNRQSDKAGVNRIPTHTTNGVTVIAVEYSMANTVGYFKTLDNVDELTVRFMRMKGEAGLSFDANRTVNPTPRQWEWVARKLAQNPSTPLAVIAGRITRALAGDLLDFRSFANDIPDLADVIANPTTAKVPTQPPAQFLVVDKLVEIADQHNFKSILEYVKRIIPDVQVRFGRFVMKEKTALTFTEEFGKWSSRFADQLRVNE
jgi:hypothetical protein